MRARSKNWGRHLGNKGERGFSLIELLIVVAIILIIAAIAIPNLIRSKIAANEASAAGTLRTMHTAAHTYFSTWGNGYPDAQGTMGGIPPAAATCGAAQVIDNVLAVPGVAKSGYNFTYTAQGPARPVPAVGCPAAGFDQFVIVANPVTVGTTGQRAFCTEMSGVLRADPAGGPIGNTSAACLVFQPIQ